MDDSRNTNPLLFIISLCLVIGGLIFAAQHYEIHGLDKIAVTPKQSAPVKDISVIEGDLFRSASFVGSSREYAPAVTAGTVAAENPFNDSRFQAPKHLISSLIGSTGRTQQESSNGVSGDANRMRRVRNIRIASWALSGFGPSKLGNDLARRNLVRIIRQFDIVCLQQLNSSERDLVPRIVDEINEGGRTFDFVLGEPTGPPEHTEQLAILFNVTRVLVDRSQTYTVTDPQNQMTYDPMVAWFRAAKPALEMAWTFSVVNVRVNLSRAPVEVALLPGIFSSVKNDGRGEDDVVMAGMFQADDSYLLSRTMGDQFAAAVRSTATDLFGRHQTCNVLLDREMTSEYIGRGGPVDFLRLYNLSIDEAETVSSHLPVFAEFTATEGGKL